MMAACGRTPPPPAPTANAAAPPAMAAVARRALPAVVNIYALKAEPRPTFSALLSGNLGFYGALSAYIHSRLEPRYEGSGSGSGFIINKRGYILTNHHVIAGADRIIVRVAHRGEIEQDARILGSDPASDVAMLKIRADYRHHVLPLGNSETLQPGEWVAAVGNPYGVGKTFTAGVVSAVKREDLGIIEMEDFIQTDAAISPGNSGGPLININGEAVGINTAIQSDAAGIGFAVPVNIAIDIMAPLAAGERIRRGTLGITAQDLTPEAARHLRIEGGEGALVTGVYRGGPAQTAGIQPNDVITGFNGEKITHYAQLKKAVLSLPAGVRVTVTLVRETKPLTVKATLAEVKMRKKR
ncbi:MAG: trypsin-like peptidase domain-containing protein [Nitrospinae bacterium]|nr:trypsin-like peptidase domain-containing protein [Nitrospinota bacterium]